MNLQVLDSTLNSVAKLFNQIRAGVSFTTTNSYMDITKLTRVEPLVAVSRDLLPVTELTSNLMPVLLNMFSGYYLQSLETMTKLRDVEVLRTLDRLNPDRDETAWLLQNEDASQYVDNYKYRLPVRASIALEAKAPAEIVAEISNLSVGKLLNVELEVPNVSKDGEVDGNRTVSLHINVRLLVKPAGVDTLTYITTSSKNDGFIERFHKWRAGEIEMVQDLVLCRDLVRARKRAMLQDDSGILNEVLRRNTNAKRFGLLTRNPSMAAASSIFVISDAVATQIEKKYGGRLAKSKKVRDMVFDSTYAMILVVVDRDYETVTFYFDGSDESSTVTWSQLKSAGKDAKGPDIADIMRAMQNNTAPSF